jgi:hypothetical protein
MSPKDDIRREPSKPMRRFLSRKWWLGATGVIAAVGVLVPVGLWLAGGSPATTTSTSHQIKAHNGNCIIQGGIGNTCDINPSTAPPQPGSPLTVATRKDIGPCGHAWIEGRQAPSAPKPPLSSLAPNVWASWAKASGAVDARESDVTATIQAKPGTVVYITGIQFNVLQRKSPIRGTLAAPPCAGPEIGRFVDVDLDHRPPQVIGTSSDPNALVAPNGPAEHLAPLKLPYKVTNSDGLVLILYGQVAKYDCVWTADILWSSNGRTGSVRIDDNGRPFETTPMPRLTSPT